MATRYRDLIGPTALQTGIVDHSAAQTAARLAETFKQFESTANMIGGELMSQAGAKAGSAEGAGGDPRMRQGLSALTKYGAAYNNAATRTYTLKVEADIEDTAARLEVSSGNDPQKFTDVMSAVRRTAVQNALPGTEQIVSEAYARRIADGASRLANAQAIEVHKNNRAVLVDGIERATDRIGRLQSSANLADQEQALQEQAKLTNLIDAAEADGTLTPTEARTAREDSLTAVTMSSVQAKFEEELNNPYGNPAGFILRLQEVNKTSDVLSPEEEQKLVNSLMATLREHNALISAANAQQEAEAKARYDAGEKTATEMLLSGSLTRRKLLAMVQADDLDPTVARVLNNELEQNVSQGGHSDQATLFHARVNLLSYTEQDLATMPGLSYADRWALINQRRNEATGWKGTQAAQEAYDRIDRALRIPKGMMSGLLDPETAKQRDLAMTELYNQVEALPDDQKEAAVIGMSEDIAKKYIRVGAQKEAELWRRREAALLEQPKPKEGSAERRAYDQDLERFRRKAAEAEAKTR